MECGVWSLGGGQIRLLQVLCSSRRYQQRRLAEPSRPGRPAARAEGRPEAGGVAAGGHLRLHAPLRPLPGPRPGGDRLADVDDQPDVQHHHRARRGVGGRHCEVCWRCCDCDVGVHARDNGRDDCARRQLRARARARARHLQGARARREHARVRGPAGTALCDGCKPRRRAARGRVAGGAGKLRHQAPVAGGAVAENALGVGDCDACGKEPSVAF
mmetsp:Transcript_20501/g.41685  ORF Transcript_20501/g.41685 Transcript_20501/m.41685 type:complete len:215 (-) Transcript_20501:3892-4536(-)